MSRTISLWFKIPFNQLGVTSLFGFGVYGLSTYGTVGSLILNSYDEPISPNFQLWGHFASAQTDPITNLFDQWQNFVYVYEGNVTNSQFYLNGGLLSNYTIPDNTTNQLNTTETPLVIGGGNENFANSFDSTPGAQLDDMYFWDRPLTSGEVTQLYQAQSVPEPSTYALLLLSGAASLWVIKRRKH